MFLKKKIIETILFTLAIFTILLSGLKNFYPTYGSHLFQDWIYIFIHATNECEHIFNLSGYKYLTSCDQYLNSNFVYPKIWIYFIKFITNGKVFEFFIIISIIIFLYLNLKILEKLSLTSKILFFFSPVTILILERGNNDILIFILVYLFSNFFLKKKLFLSSKFYILGIILKIFPITLLPIFLIIKKKKIFFFLYVMFLSIIFLYLSDFQYLQNNYNKSGLLLSFSSSVFFKIINSVFNLNLNYKIFSILILAIIILISLFIEINIPQKNNKDEINFLISSSIIVSSFFLNEGFIYKLIFLSFALPLLHKFNHQYDSKIYKYFLVIAYLSLYFEFFSFITENIFEIDYFKFKQQPIINFENIIYGLTIISKNLIFWLLNINLIFISTKIFLRKIRL